MNKKEIIDLYTNYKIFEKKWKKVEKELKTLKEDCDGFFKFSEVVKYENTILEDKISDFQSFCLLRNIKNIERDQDFDDFSEQDKLAISRIQKKVMEDFIKNNKLPKILRKREELLPFIKDEDLKEFNSFFDIEKISVRILKKA